MKIEFVPVVSGVPLVLLARSDVDTFPYTHWHNDPVRDEVSIHVIQNVCSIKHFSSDSNEVCILICPIKNH